MTVTCWMYSSDKNNVFWFSPLFQVTRIDGTVESCPCLRVTQRSFGSQNSYTDITFYRLSMPIECAESFSRSPPDSLLSPKRVTAPHTHTHTYCTYTHIWPYTLLFSIFHRTVGWVLRICVVCSLSVSAGSGGLWNCVRLWGADEVFSWP